jgi:hypothetical protein
MSEYVFSSAREALKHHLAEHEARERHLNERVCERCFMGEVKFRPMDRLDCDNGLGIVSVLLPRYVGGGKIVALVVDMSQDFKEYRCPECGRFEEFLGLRRRECQ